MRDIVYWVWLALKNGAGSAEAIKLLQYFPGGAKDIYDAEPAELRVAKECSANFLNRLADHDLSSAGGILEFCFMNGIRIIPCSSPNYPHRLHDLHNKPVVLYVRGNIADINERFCISVVGTRSMSEYGKHMTFQLVRELVAYGALVISGAAYGIDSAANSTAVFLEEPTVAVLGSGVNVPYPVSNKAMLDWIGANGMVVSEYPPNTSPRGQHFPVRNRIISGLADAVLVVEADQKSGALITARRACEQRRRVYAVPGNVGAPNSGGTNALIRDGAKMVVRTEDIIEDYMDHYKLGKIDRIINSDKYQRYEYNRRIPVLPENQPIPIEKQEEQRARMVIPPISKAADVIPDIPSVEDLPENYVRTIFAPEKQPAQVQQPVKPAPQQRMRYNQPDTVPAAPARPSPAPQTEPEVSGMIPNQAERERVFSKLGDVERRVFDAMPDHEVVAVDTLAQMGIPAETVTSSLVMMELYSAVKALPGGFYKKLI